MKNIRFFLSEKLPVLVVKFSIYLNRRVFVMQVLAGDKCYIQFDSILHTLPQY